MPIYEYLCRECQGEFELMRSFKDADVKTTCIHCQGLETKRKLSLFNASSSGRRITSSSGCNGCSSGSCNSCGSH